MEEFLIPMMKAGAGKSPRQATIERVRILTSDLAIVENDWRRSVCLSRETSGEPPRSWITRHMPTGVPTPKQCLHRARPLAFGAGALLYPFLTVSKPYQNAIYSNDGTFL